MNQHFLKTLVIFTGMIILGLVGVFLVSYFDGSNQAGMGNGKEACKTGQIC